MKNTKTCPKCKSVNIVKIPGEVGAYGSGNIVKRGISFFNAICVTRYLCCQCGYSEEWIDNKNDIELLRKDYSHISF